MDKRYYVAIHTIKDQTCIVETIESCCDSHALDYFVERALNAYTDHDSTLITPESIKHSLAVDKKMCIMSAEISKYFEGKH